MARAEEAAARLPQVKQLAEQHGNALRSSFGLLLEGALVGPAADRLLEDLADRHRDVRAGFYAAFDAVDRLAAQAEGGPPRGGELYIPGPPRGGRRASVDVRSASPDGLHRLGVELGRAGREWEDAGGALVRILDGLGLNTGPGHGVRRAGTWVAGQQQDVQRRRDELLKADRDAAVQAAVQSAMGVVRGLARGLGQDGDRKGPWETALRKTWHDYTHRYLAGVWDGSKDLGLYALASNPATAPVYMMTDWGGWVRRGPVGQAKGLAQGAQHPVEFGKAMVNWDLWKKDPLRAYGTMVPSIIIGAATMGTGSGSGAGSRLAAALGKTKPKTPSSTTNRSVRALNDAADQKGKTDPLGKQIPPGGDSSPGGKPSTEGPVAGDGAAKIPTRLEGRRDYVVDDPDVPGRTITDIDHIEKGVLWEEKSATNAGDINRWVAKHIDKKFSSYLDARQHLSGYEKAPIGFRFTSSGADPAFRAAVESAVARLRAAHPGEKILLEWS
ncbi:hypothetical protein SMC26_29165 [Actinomadura fulvescens]|uniref:WXG100 family type VII secretion target n=1 Tax=Actinomadura fulvescens TaxID=46160 RepID=A0ABP6C8V5_9ACTN